MLHTRFPLDAPMASVRGQGQSARMHKSRFIPQGLCLLRRRSSRLGPPWSSCQSRALVEGDGLSLDSLPGDRARPCMQCSAVSAGSSAMAEREGVWEVQIQGLPVGGGLYPAALQPHGSCCAAQYGTYGKVIEKGPGPGV
jgi:hypothetical protein